VSRPNWQRPTYGPVRDAVKIVHADDLEGDAAMAAFERLHKGTIARTDATRMLAFATSLRPEEAKPYMDPLARLKPKKWMRIEAERALRDHPTSDASAASDLMQCFELSYFEASTLLSETRATLSARQQSMGRPGGACIGGPWCNCSNCTAWRRAVRTHDEEVARMMKERPHISREQACIAIGMERRGEKALCLRDIDDANPLKRKIGVR